jgi:MFS transporter, ACS family, tartrate transporter
MSNTALGTQTTRRVMMRLVPFTMLLMFINHIDRSNISYAALQMNVDLGLTPAIYGFAAGIFFLGYVTFEIPSNLILARVGARRWIPRIMITWGAIAIAMAWVNSASSLYVLRFLLGVAEAGFLPGILYYFSLWVPMRDRAKVVSIFMSTSAISNVIGAPLSTGLLSLDGLFGLRGWQCLFIIEGLPAILLGVIAWRYLTDKPEDARWLNDVEKNWLVETLRAERTIKEKNGLATFKQAFLDWRVWLIGLIGFAEISVNFGIVFWLPQIIKSFGGLSNIEVGFLAAVPYICGAIAMILWARHSDKSGDRKWHIVTAAFGAATALLLVGSAPGPIWSFIGLCIAAAAVWSITGLYFSLPADFLTGRAAAGGYALINSISVAGGFVGPTIIGIIRDRTQSFQGSMLALAGFSVVTALLTMLLGNMRPVDARAAVASASD